MTMEVGRNSSPSSIKKLPNLSTFLKKRSHEKNADADGESNRLNQPLSCKVKSKSTDRWFPMPGRDLRLEGQPKIAKYRTFHGLPGVRKKQITRSYSTGTECFSRMDPVDEGAPRSETMTDLGSTSVHRTRSRNPEYETRSMGSSRITPVSENVPRPEMKNNSGSQIAHKALFLSFLLITTVPLAAYCLYLYLSSSAGNPCSYPEAATDRVRHFDFHQLKAELDDRVFGQGSAIAAILHALNVYFNTESATDRPMVLSLHGGMGVGKTLVARVLDSHFVGRKANVHWYFPGSGALDEWMLQRIVKCSTNIFLLDDVDKNDQIILTQLRKLLISWPANLASHHTRIVFVVTTNAGSNGINEIVVSELRQDRQRQDIPLSRFSAPKEFLDIPNLKFVPFLPLDRSIVIQCALRFLALYSYYGKNYSDSLLDGLMSDDRYFPDDFPVLSKSGCKKVHVGL